MAGACDRAQDGKTLRVLGRRRLKWCIIGLARPVKPSREINKKNSQEKSVSMTANSKWAKSKGLSLLVGRTM